MSASVAGRVAFRFMVARARFPRLFPPAPCTGLRELELQMKDKDLERVLKIGFCDVVLDTLAGCIHNGDSNNVELLAGALFLGVGSLRVFECLHFQEVMLRDTGHIRRLQCWNEDSNLEVQNVWQHLSIQRPWREESLRTRKQNKCARTRMPHRTDNKTPRTWHNVSLGGCLYYPAILLDARVGRHHRQHTFTEKYLRAQFLSRVISRHQLRYVCSVLFGRPQNTPLGLTCLVDNASISRIASVRGCRRSRPRPAGPTPPPMPMAHPGYTFRFTNHTKAVQVPSGYCTFGIVETIQAYYDVNGGAGKGNTKMLTCSLFIFRPK
ncbi:hypothetical protein FB451DRAFT_1166976 [Mycena latifolia]|nr:hypothetical protein FB451DRAFT_1166976 [Mycena latifolia]